MAKKRSRKPANRLGDETVINPLNLDHVSAIGKTPVVRQPESNSKADVLPPDTETSIEQKPRYEVEHKPNPPQEHGLGRDRLQKVKSVVGGANRAMAEKPRPVESHVKDSHQLKTRFTVQEAEYIEAFRADLSSRLGVKLRGSQISRALWTLALRAEEELDQVRAPELRRPSYGDPLGMAVFEDAIADYLLSAIKKTRRLDL